MRTLGMILRLTQFLALKQLKMTQVKNCSISQLHKLTSLHLWLLNRSLIHKMRHLNKLKKTKKPRMLTQFKLSILQQLLAYVKPAEILSRKKEGGKRMYLTSPT